MAAKKNRNPQTLRRYPPYLLARQIAALKKLSEDTGTPVQYYIRWAVDEYLERQLKRKRSRKPPVREVFG
jgi:predicted DNA-binding protein